MAAPQRFERCSSEPETDVLPNELRGNLYKMYRCFFSRSLPSHSMLAYEHRAEHVGFEPTDAVTRINALAVRPNRPLWQCSARHSTGLSIIFNVGVNRYTA